MDLRNGPEQARPRGGSMGVEPGPGIARTFRPPHVASAIAHTSSAVTPCRRRLSTAAATLTAVPGWHALVPSRAPLTRGSAKPLTMEELQVRRCRTAAGSWDGQPPEGASNTSGRCIGVTATALMRKGGPYLATHSSQIATVMVAPWSE